MIFIDNETMPLQPGKTYDMQVVQGTDGPDGPRITIRTAPSIPRGPMNPDIDEYKTWAAQAMYALSGRDRYAFSSPDPLAEEWPGRPKRPNQRRRPTEDERTKARSRGKAARKARRAGR